MKPNNKLTKEKRTKKNYTKKLLVEFKKTRKKGNKRASGRTGGDANLSSEAY